MAKFLFAECCKPYRCGFGTVFYTKFSKNFPNVIFYSLRADTELVGNLFVCETPDYELHNFDFAAGEVEVAVLHSRGGG